MYVNDWKIEADLRQINSVNNSKQIVNPIKERMAIIIKIFIVLISAIILLGACNVRQDIGIFASFNNQIKSSAPNIQTEAESNNLVGIALPTIPFKSSAP